MLLWRGMGVVGGGCGNVRAAGMCGAFGELYTARFSGGVPGFFVPLLFGIFYSQKWRGYKAWYFTL